MKIQFLFSLIFSLSLVIVNAQPAPAPVEKPTITFLGTFHFAGSSDLIALKVDDLRSDKRQKEIEELVDALAKYKPTKVIIEYPYQRNRMDSLYQRYLEDKHDLSINEIQQIGFRLARQMGHPNIYPADYRMDLPFDGLMAFLGENDRMHEFQEMFEFMKTEVLAPMQREYDRVPIKEFLAWMNNQKFDKMNKNLYLKTINNMGAKDNYVGTEVVATWWDRNFRIMRNIDEITEPGDRVLVLFGQGHTALLKDFYQDRTDVDYVDILKYLKE